MRMAMHSNKRVLDDEGKKVFAFSNRVLIMEIKKLSVSVFMLLILSACGGPLVSVDVTVVDQKTALENQILGSYEEIGNDMALLASVRSVDEEGALITVAEIPKGKKEAIRARQRQEFNHDDVQMFKKESCAGEGKDGLVALLTIQCTKKNDPKFIEFAKAILEEENKSRLIILQRIIDTNENFAKDDMPKVQKIFAGLNRDKALPGEWIQLDTDQWQVKK
jgi:hypothetical protein